jgi:aldehyde dehydrogenase (NAD+)
VKLEITIGEIMLVGMNYIDGSWCPARPDFSSINPSTEEELGVFPQSTPVEVDEAVQVAKKAQKQWKQLSRIKRGEYFDNLIASVKAGASQIAIGISKETGKTLNESTAEVNEAIHMAEYTFGRSRVPIGEMLPSEIPEKDAYVIRKPKGVVAIVSPWNFPLAIGGFWCAAPALLEGNTVVFKPSEDTPGVGQIIASMYEMAGFPPGVFNLVHGDGKVGAELVCHSDISHVCFTGSYEVGKFIKLECANHGRKSCSCEMGSKSAVIVCTDSDMDMAVKACVASAYKLSGQRCVSAGRILVQQSVLQEFVQKFVAESKKIAVGNPFDENKPDMGPLINQSQMERVLYFNQLCDRDKDTTIHMQAMQLGAKGFFLTPHIYTAKWQKGESRKFLKQEVFGPHVAIIPFNDIEEAIEIYNDTDYGLSLAICTNDYKKMRKVRDECDFGLGYVNLPCIGAESHLPFKGVKQSGYGGASAAGTFDCVVDEVVWTVNHAEEIKMAQGLKV